MIALLLAVHVRLLAVNDFHGHIETAPVLASWLRAAHGDVLVHAGDLVGASPPESSLLGDEPTIDFMNELCTGSLRCVGTCGNHEFDKGSVRLLQLLKHATYPTVLANVVHDDGIPLLPKSTMLTVHGVRIGFVGAVLRGTPAIVTSTGVRGLQFLDEPDSVNAEARWLREQGAQAVVLLIHQGGVQPVFAGPTKPGAIIGSEFNALLPRFSKDIDVIVSGHSHQFTNAYAGPQRVLVTQALSYGRAFAQIDLDVGEHGVTSKVAEIVMATKRAPDAQVEALYEKARAEVAPRVQRVVATAAAPISAVENEAGESALGELIADAQRAAMKSDFAFINPGGIRGSLPAGPLTWGQLATVQPFANDLVRMELTGAEILELLAEQWKGQPFQRILKPSGLQWSWPPVSAPSIDPARTYTVTVNSFLAAGGDNFPLLTRGRNRVVGPVDLDALVEYVSHLPQPLSVKPDGRIQHKP